MDQSKTIKKMSKLSTMSKCATEEKCIPQETVITNVRLAAAYVPYETLCVIFPPLEALRRGTVFPELFSPYEGEEKKFMPFKMSKKRGDSNEE